MVQLRQTQRAGVCYHLLFCMVRSLTIRFVFLACAALMFFRDGRADAASFQADPVSLTLNTTTTNGLISIRNLGEETVRIQLSIFGWDQTPAGEIDLQPTSDLLFFPSLLTIAPHEVRNIRISAASGGAFAAIAIERSYRLIIDELLPPVFVQPSALRSAPRIEKLSAQAHAAKFEVKNTGTMHLMIRKVHVYVTASDGHKLFESSVGGWYLLAQGIRVYDVQMPAAACATGAKTTVEVETDQGNTTQHLNSTCTD
jgi:fimbrial chaperone protein